MSTRAIPALWLLGLGATGLSAQGPPGDRPCTELDSPKTLPAAGQLIDSAAAAAWAADADAGVVTVGLRYDDDRNLLAVLPVENGGQVAGLEPFVAKRGPKGAIAVRLEITLGAAAAIAVQRSEFCAPVALGEPVELATVVASRSPSSATARPVQAPRIEIEVGLTGEVERVRVGAKVSAGARQDIAAQRFRPALLDGWPVRARVRNGRATPIP